MNKVRSMGKRTFASLNIRNYRLYFIGQAISLSGTWMQTIGQGLLILKLTGSGTSLGLVTALQFLPILFLGPWGGIIADRFPKRKILYITQVISGILALILGVLVATNLIQIWMIYLLALGLGLVNVFDNPTRQTFLMEMVGKEQVTNAVALNSSEVNLARVIGPALAGGLVAATGLSTLFIINGLSYIPVLIVLFMMREEELHRGDTVKKTRGQLKEGFSYVRSNPVLLHTLIMLAIVGTLSYEFSVILPLIAQFTFHGNAGTYALLTAAMGFGAMIGGLYSANRDKPTVNKLILASFLFGVAILLASIAPTLLLNFVAMVIVGFFSINFMSQGNVLLQLESTPEMRGRVMALWTVAFLGSTPIGGPIIGWIGEHIGPRWGLAVGGLAGIAAAGLGALTIGRARLHEFTASITRSGNPTPQKGA